MPNNPNSPNSSETVSRDGIAAGLIAYLLWGFYPLYFKLVQAVPSEWMLAQRVFWSVPFGALIIMGRGQWPAVWEAVRSLRMLAVLTLAACVIGLNWGLFIWAVQNGHILQSSLGYYISPLLYVLVGVIAFKERLNISKMIAVFLAFIGVGYLTFLGGQFPWIAICLAVSFAIYGVLRKQIVIASMPGVFIETVVLLPIALIYLGWLCLQGEDPFFLSGGPSHLTGMIVLVGPVSVLPYLAFAIAARKLSLSLLGFLQFIGPTIHFAFGLYFGEALSPEKLICFVFIWAAIAMFCYGVWREAKAEKRKRAAAGA